MRMPTSNRFGILSVLALCSVMLISFSLPARANISGSISTTTSTATVVNGEHYSDKSLVYLVGGPQNQNSAGLSPDGTYYFQVTDPNGSNLLSLDDISCRQVVVSGGRIIGVPTGAAPSTCIDGYHTLGTANPANGEVPVQLCNPNLSKCESDFSDTPNNGGVYKLWLTSVTEYVGAGTCLTGNSHFGFCDSDSKTDTFKVKKPGVAYVTVCKFNDLNGNGTQDSGEPTIPGWPITATGVDSTTGATNQTVLIQTDDTGCFTFSISDLTPGSTRAITLTEGTEPMTSTGSRLLADPPRFPARRLPVVFPRRAESSASPSLRTTTQRRQTSAIPTPTVPRRKRAAAVNSRSPRPRIPGKLSVGRSPRASIKPRSMTAPEAQPSTTL
jgi:hypothetical protein